MWEGVSPSPGADVGGGEPQSRRRCGKGVSPSPGADVAQMRPILMKMWPGVSPVPARMWADSRVPKEGRPYLGHAQGLEHGPRGVEVLLAHVLEQLEVFDRPARARPFENPCVPWSTPRLPRELLAYTYLMSTPRVPLEYP
jgi:hypothetical protein